MPAKRDKDRNDGADQEVRAGDPATTTVEPDTTQAPSQEREAPWPPWEWISQPIHRRTVLRIPDN